MKNPALSKSRYKSKSDVWIPFGLWRIDKYYIKFYAKVFLVILFGLTALVAIGDLFQRFDDFVMMSRRENLDFYETVVTFAKYYATFVPQMVLQYMLPVAMLLAATITITASYAGPRGNNEYTVIRSAGVPVLRSFFPLIFSALVFAAAFQATRDLYLPTMVREANSILNRLRSKTNPPTSVSLITPYGYQTAAIGWFSPHAVGYNLILESRDTAKFQRGDMRRGDNDFVAYRAAEAKLEPDPEGTYHWVPMVNAKVQTFTTFSRHEQPWTEPVPTTMTPAMLERQTLGDAVSSWRDLRLLREDNAGAKFEMYWRLVDPLACCLLVLWGAGICMGLMLRGGNPNYIKSVSISMLAAGLFYCLRLAGRALWEQGMLQPYQGAFIPVAIAAIVALPIALWMEW